MLSQDRLLQINKRLDEDFRYYARFHLKIRDKFGNIVAFLFNYAQDKLHDRIEKQKMATGRVRMLILKARQQGFSTYTGGRFYHHTTRFPGKATFILSHEADTTEKLFQIVERYHKNCPDAARMQTDVANRRRMVFSGINSEYFVGTAGNENVGRGGTVQYLHASEAAFYPDGAGFSKGLLQSVPDLSGTEVIIESTANGMDPLFYKMCMDAQNGIGEFELFFSPWFWQQEYRKQIPENFVPTREEEALANLYQLDWEQIYWRRNKIQSAFQGNIKDFMQEYPACVEEAFISSGSSLVSSFKFMEARKSVVTDQGAPLIIGIDGNEASGRVGIVFRRGREIIKAYAIKDKKPMEQVGIYCDIIDRNEPVKVFMDLGNNYAVVDRLFELGYDDVVVPVNFNDGATNDTVYLNKRCEMWDDYARWINEGDGKVKVPDDDVFHKESVAVTEKQRTSSGLFKLEAKDIIEKNAGIKIDIGDAAALTFAYPVRIDILRRRRIKKMETTPSHIKSIRNRGRLGDGQASKTASTTMGWVQ